MLKKIALSVALLAGLAMTSNAEAGSRSAHKFGISVGLLSEPIPSVWGISAGYNFADWVRGRVGVGFINGTVGTALVDATTMAGEAMFSIPDWSFSPVAMVGYTNVSMTVTGTGDLSALGGLTQSGGAVYAGAGFDWQTSGGFNLGFNAKMLLSYGNVLPGIYLGWYF